MRVILENDTLAYYRGLPMCQLFEFSNTPVQRVFDRIEVSSSDMRNPIDDAKQFYLYSHAMSKLHTEIGDTGSLGIHVPFVTEYYGYLRDQSVRMFQYMLLICIREMRHININEYVTAWAATFFEGTEDPRYKAWKQCKDIGGNTVLGIKENFWFDVSVHEMVHSLTKAYKTEGFGGSFGGPKWALISQTLDNFITGKITAEVLYDTAFSLQHNTSNIFNKPFLYESVSDKDLIQVLDHQRAGQIPQLLYQLDDVAPGTKLRDVIDQYPALQLPELEMSVDHHAMTSSKPVGDIKKPPKYNTPEKHVNPKPWNSLTPVAKKIQLLPTLEIKTE